jgi:lipopolysaccharide export system permease protein
LRTIDRYVTSVFVTTFLAALCVITFVMSMGALFKIIELLAKGTSWVPVVQIFLYSIPFALGFSIPISALVSSLLEFGRLSADGEITAMKACGLSLWQVIMGPLVVSLVLAVVCLLINSEIGPRCHGAQRTVIATLGMESPADLLEEGRFIQDFPGMSVYVGKKKGNQLTNVRIYDMRQAGIKREIVAKTGVIVATNNGANIVIELYDVRIDPFYDNSHEAAICDKLPIEIGNVMTKRSYNKKASDMGLIELTESIDRLPQRFSNLGHAEQAIQRMSYVVELHERFVLALACFAFVLLGIPLGIKTHRKESSAGVGISLFLVFNFYLFLIIAQSLEIHPALRPHLIAWLPIVISLTLGFYLIRRAN